MSNKGLIDLNTLSDDITKCLIAKQWNASKFANESGVNKSTVGRIINKIGTPDLVSIEMVAKTLGYSLSRYLPESGVPTKAMGSNTLIKIKDVIGRDRSISPEVKISLFELMSVAYNKLRINHA